MTLSATSVIHIVYPSAAARRRLISLYLPLLDARAGAETAWFFADTAVATPAGVSLGLEICVTRCPNKSPELGLRSWLDGLGSLALWTDFVASPNTLQPHLFPWQRAPHAYIEGLTISSRRAIEMLAATNHSDDDEHLASLASQEMAACYRGLVPNQTRRRQLILAYAEWLETSAGDQGNGEEVRPPQQPPHQWLWPYGEYSRVGVALRRHIGRNVRPQENTGHDCQWDRFTAEAALLARLVHTQVVRIRGPGWAPGLRAEARIARSLASLDGSWIA